MFLIPDSYITVKKTRDHGRGVFAAKDIEAGTVIGDYLGTIVHEDDEDEIKHGLYYLYFNEKATIYASPREKGIHLINHSCAPNCWMRTWKGRTLYFATRHIFKGEQVTVSYLLGTAEDEEIPCQHTCKCGTLVCTGTFHNSQEASDRWEDFDSKGQEKYFKKVPGKYGSKLPPLPAYPKTIADNPISNIFGSFDKPPLACPEVKLPPAKLLRQRIRETGRRLYFPNVGYEAWGFMNGVLTGKTRAAK